MSDSKQQVTDPASMTLQLRSDLEFIAHHSAGESYFVVEDPLNSRFFRIGQAEHAFASCLDGKTTIRQALSRLSTALPHHQLGETEAAVLCRWLVEMDLAQTADSMQPSRLLRSARQQDRKRALARFNPLLFRVPIYKAEIVLEYLHKPLGWMFSPITVLGWLGLLIFAAFRLLGDWDRFALASYGVFAPHNWVWFLLCWIGLKLVHEIGHGVACKRYGGTVREGGLLFIFLAPLAYVDVTSSWRFRSRRQRICVAAAGMYVELAIAAVAAIVWSQTGRGWLNTMCFNAVVTASVTTILFNANPLMRFDGYYILSDTLNMPNLYGNGQGCLRYLVRRFMLNVPAQLPNGSAAAIAFTFVYGSAAFLWRTIVCCGLIVTAITLFKGAGIILSAVAVLLWLAWPTCQFVRYLFFGDQAEVPNRIRFVWTGASVVLLIGLALGCVSWPGRCKSPAVVLYAPLSIVRAGSDGFVREIHVTSGQEVREGQLLAVLENRELENEIADLVVQIRISELRGRDHRQNGMIAAQQAEARQRQALRERLLEKQSAAKSLRLQSPCRGRVASRDLESLRGRFLSKGAEVVLVGDDARKELRVSVAEDDLRLFQSHLGKSLQVELPRRKGWKAPLAEIAPRAELTPPHPSLAAVNGGPLAVTAPSLRSEPISVPEYQLFSPRFTAILPLSAERSRQLKAGEAGSVSYRPYHESIGEHFYRALSRWVRNRTQSAHRQD